MHVFRATLAVVAALVLGAGCGDDKPKEKKTDPVDETPALAMPAIGVPAVKQMNFIYGDGEKAYDKAQAAYKKKDWAAVKAACEEALSKDPGHLEAHRLLGTALAQLGDLDGATGHLVTAVAGDFVRWGPKLLEDKDLAAYLASPQGKALFGLHAKMKAAAEAKIAGGLWLLGRRGAFKWPSKKGNQWAATRGELYAYDAEDKTFIRLTHTDHEVAAWLPSPGGDEIALVGYDRVDMPDPRAQGGKLAKTTPPILARAWVETIDPRTFEPRGKRATFTKVRGLSVYYGVGGQLLVDTLKPSGRWTVTESGTWSIDPSTGKTAKSQAKADPASGTVRVTLDEAAAWAPPRGLKMSRSPADPILATEITIDATGRTISVPESGLAPAGNVRLNPGGTRLAFSTFADPCSKDGAKPSIYMADTKTGQLKHLLTAASRFGLRWLDDDHLVYEDDAGALRIVDATAGRESGKITEKAGLALAALSSTAKPICTKEPEVVEADDGSEGEGDDGGGDASDGGDGGDGAGSGTGSGSGSGDAPAATP